MTDDAQKTAPTVEELAQIRKDMQKAEYINANVCRLLDWIHEHASEMPYPAGLKKPLAMVSALQKELRRMKEGNPPIKDKPWLKWAAPGVPIDRGNIAAIAHSCLEDLVMEVVTEEDDDDRSDFAVVLLRHSLTSSSTSAAM
jgi:hypothetical protein